MAPSHKATTPLTFTEVFNPRAFERDYARAISKLLGVDGRYSIGNIWKSHEEGSFDAYVEGQVGNLGKAAEGAGKEIKQKYKTFNWSRTKLSQEDLLIFWEGLSTTFRDEIYQSNSKPKNESEIPGLRDFVESAPIFPLTAARITPGEMEQVRGDMLKRIPEINDRALLAETVRNIVFSRFENEFGLSVEKMSRSPEAEN